MSQKVKLFMRQIGVPDQTLGVVSAEDAEEELEYRYLSQGYRLLSAPSYLGDVRNSNNGVQGYRFAVWLAKEDGQVRPASEDEDAVDNVIGSNAKPTKKTKTKKGE